MVGHGPSVEKTRHCVITGAREGRWPDARAASLRASSSASSCARMVSSTTSSVGYRVRWLARIGLRPICRPSSCTLACGYGSCMLMTQLLEWQSAQLSGPDESKLAGHHAGAASHGVWKVL